MKKIILPLVILAGLGIGAYLLFAKKNGVAYGEAPSFPGYEPTTPGIPPAPRPIILKPKPGFELVVNEHGTTFMIPIGANVIWKIIGGEKIPFVNGVMIRGVKPPVGG